MISKTSSHCAEEPCSTSSQIAANEGGERTLELHARTAEALETGRGLHYAVCSVQVVWPKSTGQVLTSASDQITVSGICPTAVVLAPLKRLCPFSQDHTSSHHSSASNALGRSDCSVLRPAFLYLPPSLLLQHPSSNSAYLLQTSAHQDINMKQDICWEPLEEDNRIPLGNKRAKLRPVFTTICPI
ncbi:hypothetical protein NA56DRAFT_698577 [Hyaloscypha hepaticicola]|uniref:Uncharacterized protein n=1 Tax=Hyaloscypha hepaticicola TaxID=2082293 RepID=A0A2J6QJF8_9HELO|nr:hypothetical protein NA56DRAFT_698577 [Hyaloscypha hepaticicola]